MLRGSWIPRNWFEFHESLVRGSLRSGALAVSFTKSLFAKFLIDSTYTYEFVKCNKFPILQLPSSFLRVKQMNSCLVIVTNNSNSSLLHRLRFYSSKPRVYNRFKFIEGNFSIFFFTKINLSKGKN